ncbi:MAG: phosphoribosylglycinamide formyltransferase, partial [Candidatus Binatia bacterium]
MAREVPLGVLISGSGTNLQAIIDAIEEKRLDASIRVVISNRGDAQGLVRAKNHRIPTEVVDHHKASSREAYEESLIEILNTRQVELVILAGFMRLLSPLFVKAFSNRIMNIHPSLLPAFPGLRVQ